MPYTFTLVWGNFCQVHLDYVEILKFKINT